MSRVFVARDEALGREVVIKVLLPELAAGLSAERFTREIKLAAALQEPHIVPVLAAGQTDAGLPWYTMPFVAGESVRARLAHGAMHASEALGILRNIAQALAYAHERGIVHRDIKPENVLLSSGTAVVTDFGIAKALSASKTVAPGGTLTSAGSSIGTPAYMAPEQAVGDTNTDHRADIYAWGVVAYELLAGAHPFAEHTTPATLVTAHLTEVPEPLADNAWGVPDAVSELVMKCLEKSPDARPQTMTALLADLAEGQRVSTPMTTAETRAAEAAEAIAKRPKLPPKPKRPREPKPIPSATAEAHATSRLPLVIVIVVAALALTVFAWMRTRAPDAPVAAGGTTSGAGAATIGTVAVLPFVNTGGDAKDEYFSDGMTDELAHALSKLPGLRLAGRSSSFAYKGKSVPATDIGKALSVAGIVEGTVRRAGNRLRITVQLTSTADGKSMWESSYESASGDVFQVQDSVTRAVVAAIAPTLKGAGPAVAAVQSRGTDNAQAYDLYLRGSYLFAKRGAAELNKAVELLEQATAADPKFARAFATLATAYAIHPNYDARVPVAPSFAKAEKAARQAIALDSTIADAHVALGLVRLRQFDAATADAERATAMRLEPNNALVRHWNAITILTRGRFEEALKEIREAEALDPGSATTVNTETSALHALRRYDEAYRVLRRAVEFDPSYVRRFNRSPTVYLYGGAIDSAVAVADLMFSQRLNPGRGNYGVVAFIYAAAGKWTEFDRVRAIIEHGPSAGPPVVAADSAVFFAVLGDHLKAIGALERNLTQEGGVGNFAMIPPGCDVYYEPLKSDPAFIALMKRLNLPTCPEKTPWPIKPRPAGAK